MNWNGQRQTLEHLIALALNPSRGASLQADFNSKRRSRIQSALSTRPLFLPLQFSMTAAAQTTPYRDLTPSLGYDVFITGIKTDTPSRSINLRRTESERAIVRVGDEVNLYLTGDDVAGTTAGLTPGQNGVFYFPAPIVIKKGTRLTVEMYKQDATADPEVANVVLIGVRALNPAWAEMVLDDDEKNLIEQIFRVNETPSPLFLKVPVNFDNAGVGGIDENILTPRVEVPLLVRGMRSTLAWSTIELNVEGEPTWTPRATPIWAVANESNQEGEAYIWFSKPVYLKSDNQISITRVTNGGVDGLTYDDQTGNTITFICETV